MANTVKYADQTWGAPLAGERLSTNGHYTGEHKGSVMQDAASNAVNQAHEVEYATVRYGTMMGDAAAGSMPGLGVQVKQVLSGVTSNKNDGVYAKNANFEATYTVTSGYTLPSAVTVTIGGKTGVANTDYTYSAGKVTITAAKLTGDVVITVTGTKS